MPSRRLRIRDCGSERRLGARRTPRWPGDVEFRAEGNRRLLRRQARPDTSGGLAARAVADVHGPSAASCQFVCCGAFSIIRASSVRV